MKSQLSITGLLIAVSMFAVTVAAHEAARAERLTLQGSPPVKMKLVKNRRKGPSGFKGSGGPSRWEENCHYDNDGIVRCDDCDVDWDQQPPTKICIKNAICHDGTNNGTVIPCP